MIIPTRVLMSSGEHSWMFTAYIEFHTRPMTGEFIVCPFFIMRISSIYHFPPDSKNEKSSYAMVMVDDIQSKTYDEALRIIDWFKINCEILDFSASNPPAPYYSFYRTLINMLGSDWRIEQDDICLKIILECCRVIITTHNQNADLSLLAWAMTTLHTKLLSNTDLFAVIKEWLTEINDSLILDNAWSMDVADCISNAKSRFKTLKSIPVDRLPIPIR